jgi:hypothetical protein
MPNAHRGLHPRRCGSPVCDNPQTGITSSSLLERRGGIGERHCPLLHPCQCFEFQTITNKKNSKEPKFYQFHSSYGGTGHCVSFPFRFFPHNWTNFLIGQGINMKNLYNYENANYLKKIIFKYYNK